MYPFSCVLWAIFWSFSRQIARYLPHHRSENASKTHPKSSHDKFKTASKNLFSVEASHCGISEYIRNMLTYRNIYHQPCGKEDATM